MEQPARESTPDRDIHRWDGLRSILVGGVVSALIFYVHARLVGGAAEDDIGWQVGYGFFIGMLLVMFITDGMLFEYRKAKNSRDGTLTFWRFARTWKGLVFVAVELCFVVFAIWIMADPNNFATLPEGGA